MKKIVRYAVLLMLGCFALSLTGCDSWSATMISEDTRSNSSTICFSTFKGTKSVKMKYDGKSEGVLKATCSLEKGDMTVYYEKDGVKKEWFTLSGGDEITETVNIPEKGTVKITFECDEKCEEGDLEFEID